jgi:hypothetical protein
MTYECSCPHHGRPLARLAVECDLGYGHSGAMSLVLLGAGYPVEVDDYYSWMYDTDDAIEPALPIYTPFPSLPLSCSHSYNTPQYEPQYEVPMSKPEKYLLPFWLLAGLFVSACTEPKGTGITESFTETGDGAVGACQSRSVQPGEHPQCPGGGRVCVKEGAPACLMMPEFRCSIVRSDSGLCECACTRLKEK